MFDTDSDGYCTIPEFYCGIDNWIRLSDYGKEGLFAYLDHLKIGMFDYERWHNVLKRYILEEPRKLFDNFDWEVAAMDKMREWRAENKLDLRQAFRIMDTDFDGFIGLHDLKQFLITILRYQAEEVDDIKLERLFKLMDRMKRGCIQSGDLQ